MKDMYDIAIIGSGVAGAEAAINASIRNKKFILFGNSFLSNKLIKAPKINNYLGYADISGIELGEKIFEHLKKMNIDIVEKRVNNIYKMENYYVLMVGDKIYEARTVILATGVEFSKPIENEEEFLGRGVGYCATCDAPLYRGRTVAVVGYNKKAEGEAEYVGEIVEKVYYIPMYKGDTKFKGENIHIVHDVPVKVHGGIQVEKLIMKNTTIDVDGVFFLRDSIAPEKLVPGLQMVNEHIAVNRNMETNLEGLFAAGDCTGKPYQYMKACGEGQVAALNAVKYLENDRIL